MAQSFASNMKTKVCVFKETSKFRRKTRTIVANIQWSRTQGCYQFWSNTVVVVENTFKQRHAKRNSPPSNIAPAVL